MWRRILYCAIRHLDQWDESRAFLPWLLTIAANRCRTALQRRSERPASCELAWEPPAPEENFGMSEISEEVDFALTELRDEYRLCFILFHQNELGCQEIGEVLGCPTGTVKTWLHRARLELADRLRRRGLSRESEHELQSISQRA